VWRHLSLPSATPAIAATNRSVLAVLYFCKLMSAGLMAESNSAVFGLSNYKTNFQFRQSMFSAGLVRPDARISHSRCRPAVPIDGKNRKRILWLLHSLELKYTFQPSFPLLLCSSLSTFFIWFSSSAITEEILMRMNEEQSKFSEIHQTRLAVRGRHRAQQFALYSKQQHTLHLR
jgi:hypothetical protein